MILYLTFILKKKKDKIAKVQSVKIFFNCFVIHVISLNRPHYLKHFSTWTSPTLWLQCRKWEFSCLLVFGVVSDSASVASLEICSPLHKLLAWLKSRLCCHCYASDLCVYTLAHFSSDADIAQLKGLQLFSRYSHDIQGALWHHLQIGYLSLSFHFIQSHRQVVSYFTNTHHI